MSVLDPQPDQWSQFELWTLNTRGQEREIGVSQEKKKRKRHPHEKFDESVGCPTQC